MVDRAFTYHMLSYERIVVTNYIFFISIYYQTLSSVFADTLHRHMWAWIRVIYKKYIEVVSNDRQLICVVMRKSDRQGVIIRSFIPEDVICSLFG